MDTLYDSIANNQPDTVKIEGLKSYERFKDFWQTRVYNNDTIEGNFTKYTEQLDFYYNNQQLLPNEGSISNWEFVGPENLTSHNHGIIVSLYIDPNDINNIYSGTNASGMFHTLDGGQHWENVTDNIAMPGLGVLDIAVNPNNTSIKYIATGNDQNNYGLGIFKTTDNCISWQQILSFDPKQRMLTRKLLIDDEDPSIIYALVNKYVYRTKNSGVTWEVIFDELTIPDYWDKNKYLQHIEFKPDDHNTIYVSSVSIKTNENPTHEYSAELWKTHNVKAVNVNWQRIETGLPDYSERFGLETDPQNPDLLYVGYTVLGNSSGRKSFYLKTTNYPNYQIQDKFEKLNYYSSYSNAFSGLGYYMFDMELSPSNPNIMFLGGFNLEILNLSTNQLDKFYGVTSASNTSFHVDQRVFKSATSGGKTYLFCGNDGGVSRYNYTDDVMESINGTGLDNLQYYGIANSEAMPGFFIGGTQDNGEIGNGTGSWFRYNVGDSYENIIDPVESNIVYCTANGGSKVVKKSSNNGESFTNINSGLSYPITNGFGLNDRPFLMSLHNRSTLYVGYHEVYKTTDGGANWQQFTDFHGGSYSVST